MQITGNIIDVLPARTGTSARGTQWTSQDFVLEIPGQYPKHICLNIFGEDKIQQLAPVQGEASVTAYFDIDAHEYNGKWYNQLRCWNITRMGEVKQPETKQAQQQPMSDGAAKQAAPTPADDGLPF